uniref:Uncharacterized protein n=1 Tax=Cacopsylla melanoneura TaxID=428564 RepID=A0A8D8PV91_9HEMI
MILSIWALVSIIQIQWVLALENYPNTDKKKLCAPKGATIDIKAPICIPYGHTENGDQWENNSVANCAGLLKEQCPEFNQAECVWQPLTFNQLNVGYDCAGGTNVLFPACRLKYYASLHKSLSKKTWMEIMYVNQYGTTLQKNTDYYIIEIHRWVHSDAVEYFGDVNEPDYPLSALNSKQPGGFIWTNDSYAIKKSAITDKPLCSGGKDVDNFCSTTLHDAYINYTYYALNPSSVVSICGTEVKMDEQTNTLIKEEVCKIAQKSSLPESNNELYNVKVCKAVKGKPLSDNYIAIDLRCKRQRSWEDYYDD